ncbi:MAG: hypothetical protein R2796_06605 [Chitinophagaceae bacterium]
MKRFESFSSFATLTTILIVCISAAVVVNGCRKTDKLVETPINTNNNNNSVEEKFFNNHVSAEPLVKALNGFLQRTNDSLHFVNTTVSRIGYPRWDKALSFKKPSTIAGKGNSADSTTVTYIPFVRDSQNYVNATMVIQSNPIDTSFSYNCDWQYAQKQNSLNSYKDTAEYYAVFFMVMDKRVFGHNKFNIIDTNLFNNGTYEPVSIELDTTNSFGRNNVLEPHQICYPIWIWGWGPCTGRTNIQPACLQPIESEYCFTYYVENGGGGTPGDGSGGDGGATGGGENGDGTPGDCNGNPTEGNRTAINNTCGPGWEPIPIEEEPPPSSTDPCDIAKVSAKKMDSIYTLSKADSVLNTIPNLATEPLEKGFPIYQKFMVNPNDVTDTTFTDIYKSDAVQTGDSNHILIIANIPYLYLWAAMLHTHPPNGYAAHSANDLYSFLNNKLYGDSHFEGSFVAASDNSQYAISITDYDKAATFFNTKSSFLDTATNGWKESSLIGKEFDEAKKYFRKEYKNNTNKENLAYEMAMAAVLNSFNTGITLHKKDSNGNFKPIVVKTVIPNPNKPKKKQYVQDCL